MACLIRKWPSICQSPISAVHGKLVFVSLVFYNSNANPICRADNATHTKSYKVWVNMSDVQQSNGALRMCPISYHTSFFTSGLSFSQLK